MEGDYWWEPTPRHSAWNYLWSSGILQWSHRAAVYILVQLIPYGSKWSQSTPCVRLYSNQGRKLDWPRKINWVCVSKWLMGQGQPLLCVSLKEDVESLEAVKGGLRVRVTAAAGRLWSVKSNNRKCEWPRALTTCNRDARAFRLAFRRLKYHPPRLPDLHEGEWTLFNQRITIYSTEC